LAKRLPVAIATAKVVIGTEGVPTPCKWGYL
jgi:hypothetical protein